MSISESFCHLQQRNCSSSSRKLEWLIQKDGVSDVAGQYVSSFCHLLMLVTCHVGCMQAGWCVLIMRSSSASVHHHSITCATGTLSMNCWLWLVDWSIRCKTSRTGRTGQSQLLMPKTSRDLVGSLSTHRCWYIIIIILKALFRHGFCAVKFDVYCTPEERTTAENCCN